MSRLRVSLFGRFSVCDLEGTSITPRSAKTQGLLALLLLSPDGFRNRVWLQDKLWSDRGKEQGSGSLRQALVEIRRAFGNHSDLLSASRQAVGLDLSGISVTERQPGQELLEGLDVRDQEFEAWLRLERARQATVPTLPPAVEPRADTIPAVLIQVADTPQGELSDRALELVDIVTRSVREFSDIRVYQTMPPYGTPPSLCLAIRASFAVAPELRLRATLSDACSGELFWSDGAMLQGTEGLTLEHSALANRALGAILDTIHHGRAKGQEGYRDVVSMALRKIFSMRTENLNEASQLLSEASEFHHRGVFSALQAQVFATQFVERNGQNTSVLPEMAEESIARAMECEPNNSLVLAIASNVHRIFGRNFERSGELGRMAVQANRANPLAWVFLSSAWLYNGNHSAAIATARAAQRMAEGSRFKFWADFQAALVALMGTDKRRAVRLLESSHALAPHFRPPMRYLTALYAGSGRFDQAEITARRLRKVEADFSAERLALDTSYPVSLLRSSGMLDSQKLLDINDI